MNNKCCVKVYGNEKSYREQEGFQWIVKKNHCFEFPILVYELQNWGMVGAKYCNKLLVDNILIRHSVTAYTKDNITIYFPTVLSRIHDVYIYERLIF